MFNRRGLLLALAALPVPVAAAVAEPWWDERRERRAWERERERERRWAYEHHREWDERRAYHDWERRQREMARRDWERTHRDWR